MLRIRIRKNAADARRAIDQLAEIRASVEALGDEDLLDLADIFSGRPEATLSGIAAAAMQRRNLSL